MKTSKTTKILAIIALVAIIFGIIGTGISFFTNMGPTDDMIINEENNYDLTQEQIDELSKQLKDELNNIQN